jgi:hypothetical protein
VVVNGFSGSDNLAEKIERKNTMSAIEEANNELKRAEEAHRQAEADHVAARCRRNNTEHAVRQARVRLDNLLNEKRRG